MENDFRKQAQEWAREYGYGSGLAEKLGVSKIVLTQSYASGLSWPMVATMTVKCTPGDIEFFCWYAARLSKFRSPVWGEIKEEIGFGIDIFQPIDPAPLYGPDVAALLAEKFGGMSERKLEKIIGVGRSTINSLKDPAYRIPPISIWNICNALEISPTESFLAACVHHNKDRTGVTDHLLGVIWAALVEHRRMNQ